MCAEGTGYETNVVTHTEPPVKSMLWAGKAKGEEGSVPREGTQV